MSKRGERLFREVKSNHHTYPSAECAAMSHAEAMCHVAAALEAQNELLEDALLEDDTNE